MTGSAEIAVRVRRHHPPRRWSLGVTLIALVMAATSGTALALFERSASAAHTLDTATLQPPTNPATAAGTCTLLVSDSIKVSWTRTASSWADGYEVLRSTTSGGPYTSTAVRGQATESYTDTGLAFSATYYYRIKATKLNWRSQPTVEVSRQTRTTLCV